ncbi:permease prefix domain 1-containing protein [Micromonospora sp. NPDC049559]|uniref:permease prefix domain 1-containing protein n=1 Tax=Micromonospora sp. NPDC049559 TaxID=3155923 RepID=UPI003435C3B9
MADAIDDYVIAVDRRLYGSGRVRADMLAEIRDALDDAADAYRDAGLADGDARRAAVAEFGPARRIAAGLQDTLAVAQGRRTACLLFWVLLAPYAAAEYASRHGHWEQSWGGVSPGGAYLWLARAVDLFNLVALAGAAGSWILLRWGPRVVDLGRAAVRGTALLTVATAGTTLLAAALLTVPAPRVGLADLGGALAWWAPPFAAVFFSAARTWRAAAGVTG